MAILSNQYTAVAEDGHLLLAGQRARELTSQFGTPLVVVLGHTRCGAVTATLQELERPTEGRSPNLRSIVDRIRPAVETLLETDLKDQPDELHRQAVRANVRHSADHLRHGSRILEQLIGDGELLVVGAEYSLETGVVEFFDVPAAAER